MKPLKPGAISATLLTSMNACGTTGVSTKSRKEKPIHTRLKQTMPNCAITWRAWGDDHAVFRAAQKP